MREFYIEKIKVGTNERKLCSYGAAKYADFEQPDCENDNIYFIKLPEVVKWCKRKNYAGEPEADIVYKKKKKRL